MKIKIIISGFLLIFFIGAPLFPQDEPVRNTAKDISLFEKRFKNINESMNYLKDKNIDRNDIIAVYNDAESLFKEVKYAPELKDYDMTVKFLSDKLTELEEKSLERVSLVKRMDFLYNLMVSLGLAIIVIMSSYSIYMYSRRK